MAKTIIGIDAIGSWDSTEMFLEQWAEVFKNGILDKYGQMGVDYLELYTPKRTGLTSRSWSYDIKWDYDGTVELIFSNSNIQNGQNVALILQLGHATAGGGYFQGIDYINPALAPVFELMANQAYEEVATYAQH